MIAPVAAAAAGSGSAASSSAAWLPAVASIGSALISGAASLFGGYKAQKAQGDTNRTNLQIARETNQQQLDMFNRGLEYNSFQNQRKMLEEAGFSPYSLFGTSPQNAPAAPQLHVAQMMPEDAFGRSVGSAVGDMANNLLSLSQAFKNHEEATSQRIENKMLPYMLDLQAKGYATQNDLLKIQKVIQEATMQDNIDMVGIQKLLTESNFHLTEQQVTRAIIENAFEREYGGRMRQKQIDALAAKAFSDFQNGILTSKEIEYLPQKVQVLLRKIKVDEKNADTNAMNARINAFNAQTNRIVGRANADYLHSSAGLIQVQKSIQQRDLDYLSQKGYSKIAFELEKLRNEADLLNRQYVQKGLENTYLFDTMDNRIELIYQEAQRAIERGDWYEGQLMMSVINPFSGFTK